MDRDAPERWTRIWRAAQEPLTWLLGAVLLVFELVVRHSEDQLGIGACLLLLGVAGAATIVRLTKKELDDE